MDVERFLPLKARDYHILFALSRGPLHGYGLTKALERQSDGLLRLDPTSLYRRLRALLRDGLVEQSEDDGDREGGVGDDDRRNDYALTELGLAVLQAEVRRMSGLVREAEATRLVPEP